MSRPDQADTIARHPRGLPALLLLLLMAAPLAPGCKATCRDADGDGRGEGCDRGPDCDDDDPRRAARCIDVPPRCEENPTLEGCPCFADLDDTCYAAPAETLGVGMCRAGRADCAKGVFLACEGEVLPELELCNELDDDCDGVVDEHVASPCGGCDPSCLGSVWGPPVAPFEASEGLAVTEAGELTLARRLPVTGEFVWVPNTGEGTLSKLDAERAVELARYPTPRRRPVRVAVDHRGDPWILDRPSTGPAWLAKLSSEPERCVDRDGDGLETSAGPEQRLDDDECWLLDFPVGEAGDGAAALAIDGAPAPDAEPAGNPWVGLATAQRVLAFDAATGQQLTAAELPGFAPHHASFDAWGTLWLLDSSGQLLELDPSQASPDPVAHRVELACYTLDSLYVAADASLLFAGSGCESVVRFDPRTKQWRGARAPGLFSPSAIAVAGGRAWVAHLSGHLSRFDRDAFAVAEPIALATEQAHPFESVSLAADDSERLWIVSVQGAAEGRGLATRFDPERGEVTAQVPVGSEPRGVGDLTGRALAGDFVREAAASHIFEPGCGGGSADGTRWKAVHLTARVGVGGSVGVAVRRAADRDSLEAEPFVELGNYPRDGHQFALSLAAGGVLEVRLTLRAEHAIGAPRIARAGVEWGCSGPE